MLDFSQFAAAFPTDGPKPYDQNGVREIETFRKTFGGVLFIDRVLKALGVGEGAQPYISPPARPTNAC
jgi:hypothetical protein